MTKNLRNIQAGQKIWFLIRKKTCTSGGYLKAFGGYIGVSEGQLRASGCHLEASYSQHEASQGQHGASEGQFDTSGSRSSGFPPQKGNKMVCHLIPK